MRTLVVRHEFDVDETMDGDIYETLFGMLHLESWIEAPEAPIKVHGIEIGKSLLREIRS